MGQISEIVERTREEDFSVLSGDDGMTLPMLSVGADGCISVAANVEPERTCAMVGAAVSGDYERARDLHHELGPLFRALFAETNPIPVKEAMEIRGYGPAHVRQPLSRLAEEYVDDLEAVLADLEGDAASANADRDATAPEAER